MLEVTDAACTAPMGKALCESAGPTNVYGLPVAGSLGEDGVSPLVT